MILPARVALATLALGEPCSSAELREYEAPARSRTGFSCLRDRHITLYASGALRSEARQARRFDASLAACSWWGTFRPVVGVLVYPTLELFAGAHWLGRDQAALRRITEDSHLSRFPGPLGFQPRLSLREFMIQEACALRRRPIYEAAATSSFLRKGAQALRTLPSAGRRML